MRKVVFVVLTLVMFFGILFYVRRTSDVRGVVSDGPGEEIMGEEVSSVKFVAICPTMDRVMSKEIVLNEYTFVNVGSTSEAVSLLNEGYVDYAISGRIPMEEEGMGEYAHLRRGDGQERFSFLSNIVEVVNTSELNNYEIYTDLEEGVLEVIFDLERIEYVENIYDFSSNGILITSWENTDYTRASIVHIMENETSRNIFSRLPTLFCKTECLEEDVLKLTELFNI